MISMKRIRAGIAVAALAAATLFATVGGGDSAMAISPMRSPIGGKRGCVANRDLPIRKLPNAASRQRGTLAAGTRVKKGTVLGTWMKVSRGWVKKSGLTCS